MAEGRYLVKISACTDFYCPEIDTFAEYLELANIPIFDDQGSTIEYSSTEDKYLDLRYLMFSYGRQFNTANKLNYSDFTLNSSRELIDTFADDYGFCPVLGSVTIPIQKDGEYIRLPLPGTTPYFKHLLECKSTNADSEFTDYYIQRSNNSSDRTASKLEIVNSNNESIAAISAQAEQNYVLPLYGIALLQGAGGAGGHNGFLASGAGGGSGAIAFGIIPLFSDSDSNKIHIKLANISRDNPATSIVYRSETGTTYYLKAAGGKQGGVNTDGGGGKGKYTDDANESIYKLWRVYDENATSGDKIGGFDGFDGLGVNGASIKTGGFTISLFNGYSPNLAFPPILSIENKVSGKVAGGSNTGCGGGAPSWLGDGGDGGGQNGSNGKPGTDGAGGGGEDSGAGIGLGGAAVFRLYV